MPEAPTTQPAIDRRAIWRRLMDRAQASQRTPTAIEPAGYQFTPDVIEALPAEAQTELALQLGKLVLDNSQLKRAKRVIPPPIPLDVAKARAGFTKAIATGRTHSRQGVTVQFAIREGALSDPMPQIVAGPDGVPRITHKKALFVDGIKDVTLAEHALLPTCSTCEARFDPVMGRHIGRTVVCSACWDLDHRECPSCRTHVLWYDMQAGPTGPVCAQCAERLMTRCPNCDEPTPRGSVRNGTCPNCVRARFIQHYGYKPTPNFYIYPDMPLTYAPTLMPSVWCMGVELETELPRRITNVAAHAYEACRGIDDFIYAKHDGSLDYGVEYVSHPFSWEWLKGGGGARWRDFLAKLRDTQHNSYDPGTCGMHVHVTKAPFLNGPLLKLLRLSHNSPAMMLKLSRRGDESRLIQWSNPRGTPIARFEQIDGGQLTSPSKYTAINVTNKTIEFRLFRGTLNESSFLGNLEAVHAMLMFCKTTTHQHPDEEHFLEWINLPANLTYYPNMVGKLLRSTAKV